VAHAAISKIAPINIVRGLVWKNQIEDSKKEQAQRGRATQSAM
jgi:hypothetical protein